MKVEELRSDGGCTTSTGRGQCSVAGPLLALAATSLSVARPASHRGRWVQVHALCTLRPLGLSPGRSHCRVGSWGSGGMGAHCSRPPPRVCQSTRRYAQPSGLPTGLSPANSYSPPPGPEPKS